MLVLLYPYTMKVCVFITPHTLCIVALTLYDNSTLSPLPPAITAPSLCYPFCYYTATVVFVVVHPPHFINEKPFPYVYSAHAIYAPFRVVALAALSSYTLAALLFAIERNAPHIFFRVLSSGFLFALLPFLWRRFFTIYRTLRIRLWC